jgi:DNA-binding transcriptional MerR regulator
VLARLSFIKRAQSLGLSLQEIGDSLKVYDQGNLPCDELQEMLQAKVVEIDRQIEQLLTLKTQLKGLLSGWNSVSSWQDNTICPIIQPNSN